MQEPDVFDWTEGKIIAIESLQKQPDYRAKSTQQLEFIWSPLFNFFILHELQSSLSIWHSESQTQYLYVSTHHKAVHLALLARPPEPSPLVQYSNTFRHTEITFSLY